MSTSRSNKEARRYGAPLSTPKPGNTTRKRPKVGDKDPNYKPSPPKKAAPKKPKKKKAPEKKKRKSPLVDKEGVGIGGRRRQKKIDEYVDKAQ